MNELANTTGVHIAAPDPLLASYGTWPSSISSDDVLRAGVDVRSVVCDGADVWWSESHPDEDGRITVMRLRDGEASDMTPGANVRCRVHEYGGGAFDVRDGVLAFCDDADRTVKVADADGVRVIATSDGDVRFGDLRVYPERGIVLAVREDHRVCPEPETTLVALRLDVPSQGEVLASGATFYAFPELSDDGRLAWVEWDHPNMPWDATRLQVAPLTGPGLGDVTTICGRAETSTIHPLWVGADLVALSDADGYWNPQRWDGRSFTSVAKQGFDFCPAPWLLGHAPMAALDDDLLLVMWYDAGYASLGVVNLTDGTLTDVDAGILADVDSLDASGGVGYAIVSYPDRPDELISITRDGSVTTLVTAGEAPDMTTYSQPRSLTVTGQHGDFQAWFYAPANALRQAPAGELPPLIVKSHGGPTGMATCAYSTATQWWTSRGFAVLDVNYSGSAGFGREYRNRLYDQWGIADRDDCVDAVRHVAAAGLADPKRVVITGGSAGGYTTLRCLTTSDVFAAGISRYGIGDMETLATDTHKFEAHYCDYLVGPYPARREVYLERSPIRHLGGLSAPMLILQGLDDKVVPPPQAYDMADAVRAKGLPVALLTFEGEGHGFRRLATRRAVLEAQLSFLAQLFRLTPADEVTPLEIDNLIRKA